MEKAIIVSVDLAKRNKEEAQEEALEELNRLLAEGWSVKTSAAMGGAGSGFKSACIVILHKD